MKRYILAASVALAGLAAMGLNGSAEAADQIPFHGTFEGITEATGYPMFVVNASGRATHLGEFTLSMPHIVFAATMTATGTFECVAANGDTIVGSMTGTATPTGAPGGFFIVETATITGGTGRFADATGGFTIERLYNRVSGETAGSFDGSVSSPGAGD